MSRSRVPPYSLGHPGAVALPWLPAMLAPTVEAALRDAASGKVRFRRDAAFALRNASEPLRDAAVEALRRLLTDPDAPVRALSAESLAALRDTGSRDAVAGLVDDTDDGVRGAAVEALADLAGDDAAPLRRLLTHDRPDVRVRACAALAELGAEGAEEDLVRALDDPSVAARQGAVAALGWWFPGRRNAELRLRLDDPEPGVRLAAADALALVDDDAGLDVLRARLRSGPVDEAWEDALARLSGHAAPTDRELFAAHAKWPTRPRRRALALAGLARLGDEAAAARLAEWLDHRDPQRRAEALLAVGVARLERFRPALEDHLRRPGSPAFHAALVAVVQTADPALAGVVVETARTTADREVFEDLAAAADDLVRLLGDRAPAGLRDLAGASFEGLDAAPDDRDRGDG
ncbi:MAG: HEAT repeat domain-containing protein [Deltaproteobacteria bacterium]|nr:HEAT repeat domain-containing protein [Deltaproteobacteria bacterium]